MAKKQKVGLENLAAVAEEQLGIVVKGETLVTEESELSEQARIDIETEISYLQNQLESTSESVEYLLNRLVAAQKAAKEIKAAHKRLEHARAEKEKELLSIETGLLNGAVVLNGVRIPKVSKNSDVVNRIEGYKRQAIAANARVAAIIARDYGFETADEVFLLEKEQDDKK